MGKHKYKFGYGFANGLDSSEQRAIKLFEEMALQGYRLEKRYPFFWRFAPAEPGEYSFSVDFAWIASTAEFEAYKEIFAGGGWEYVCTCDGQFIFRAPKGTRPIYTDKDALLCKYKRKIIINIVQLIGASISHIAVLLLMSSTFTELLTSWVFWLFYFPFCVFPYLWCMRSNIAISRRLKRE